MKYTLQPDLYGNSQDPRFYDIATSALRAPQQGMRDAGCDALSVHLIVTNLAGSLGMGLGWRATMFSVGVMGPWALAHWEEYHSGLK